LNQYEQKPEGYHVVKSTLRRLLFVVLSTIITVFFSEKAYWHIQGYAYVELVLFYAFPVYACLLVIDKFKVQRFSALVLVASLYAFLTEGVLTTVLYEADPLDVLMPAYFIGWHGLLSLAFGWYGLRKWLMKGQWKRLLAFGLIFGLFWGTWAITWWLPEAFDNPVSVRPWSIVDFGLYAFVFASTLVLSHWLLGRGLWPREFKPSKVEKWVVVLSLGVLFSLTVLPILPWAIFKLVVLLGIIFLGLYAGRGGEQTELTRTIFSELVGPVKGGHVLTLFAMPVAATAVYALASIWQPSTSVILLLLEGIPFLQTLLGAGIFLWAILVELRLFNRRKGLKKN
jgi:hypothetical protein